jgi:DNA-binding response OmpR family regulator
MLAIEHDWKLRKLIRANLEPLGFEIQEAVNGQHGLQLLDESQPELILLDLDLPGVDMFHLLRALRARLAGRLVPIIGLSAEPPSRELRRQGYVDCYLPKPFAASALLEQVQCALGTSAKH